MHVWGAKFNIDPRAFTLCRIWGWVLPKMKALRKGPDTNWLKGYWLFVLNFYCVLGSSFWTLASSCPITIRSCLVADAVAIEMALTIGSGIWRLLTDCVRLCQPLMNKNFCTNWRSVYEITNIYNLKSQASILKLRLIPMDCNQFEID